MKQKNVACKTITQTNCIFMPAWILLVTFLHSCGINKIFYTVTKVMWCAACEMYEYSLQFISFMHAVVVSSCWDLTPRMDFVWWLIFSAWLGYYNQLFQVITLCIQGTNNYYHKMNLSYFFLTRSSNNQNWGFSLNNR